LRRVRGCFKALRSGPVRDDFSIPRPLAFQAAVGFETSCKARESDDPPLTIIRASKGWRSLQIRELWGYRELVYFLAWRDVKVRYKQTALGAAWAMLQPLLAMAIFSLFFGRLANIPSDGLPYPLFAYVGMLPWTYFANATSTASASLVGNEKLVSKIYFPRLVVPIAAVIAPLVDPAIAVSLLVALMLAFGCARSTPRWAPTASRRARPRRCLPSGPHNLRCSRPATAIAGRSGAGSVGSEWPWRGVLAARSVGPDLDRIPRPRAGYVGSSRNGSTLPCSPRSRMGCPKSSTASSVPMFDYISTTWWLDQTPPLGETRLLADARVH
jgi:hypothetical protein